MSPTQTNLYVSRAKRGVLSLFLLGVFACQQQAQPEQKGKQDPISNSKLESRLTLNNATLEQSNVKGQTLWKVKAQRTVYSHDQKIAHLEGIAGNIFEDGKLILQVSGKRGEVYKDGEEIFLKGEILVIDPRNQAAIRGEEVEWHPKQDLLIVRQNLNASHPKLEVSANEGRYFSRVQRLELNGNIVAVAKDPPIQMKAEHLFWDISLSKIVGDRSSFEKEGSVYPPLEIVRYQNETITDRVLTDRLQVNLNNNIALLQKNVELKSLAPPLQIASNSVIWNYKTHTVISDRPVQIVHSQEQVEISGNEGIVDLKQKVARLKGGVIGISRRERAKLYSRELFWQIPTQMVEAQGNVIYEQADPPFNLTGAKAAGKLANNSIVVSGDRNDRVVTKIIP